MKGKVVNKKAFFFLRHNNDIDHIVPVIYKWLKTEKIPTEIIITTKRNFLNDYRIEFLKKFENVKISYINDLFPKISREYFFNHYYSKYVAKSDKYIKKFSFIKRIADKTTKNIANKIFKDTDEAIVVFDWTITYFVKQMVKNAKERGFITISLPHGDAPYVNDMTTNDKLKKLDLVWDGHQIFDIFDYVVSPNNLCLKRYDRYLDKKKLRTLGSPRYSDEWMDILSDIKKSQKIDLGKGKKKIVLFLRNEYYPVFWQETARTIYMISKFPNLFLVVKHHPRGQNTMKEFEGVRDLPNVVHAFGDINSDALLEWADVVMDIGTSIVWEPIKKKIPVLALEYLHANYTTSAYYIKNSEIKHRDQLYELLQKIDSGKLKDFYDEKDRQKFIKDMIDVPDGRVLERYVKFLKECFN